MRSLDHPESALWLGCKLNINFTIIIMKQYENIMQFLRWSIKDMGPWQIEDQEDIRHYQNVTHLKQKTNINISKLVFQIFQIHILQWYFTVKS